MNLSKKIISLPIEIQYFPFLPSYMKYILQNSSPKLLLKLYQCCKYFYFKSQIIIAPNLWFDPKEKEIEFKFFVNNGKRFFFRAYPNIEKLWLCEKLQIYSFSDAGLIGNVFFNKIYRNTLRKLSILSGFTLIKELEILSKSPNLTIVKLDTSVTNENDELIPIEKIMVLFPQIKKLRLLSSCFTMESFEKLSEFKFLNKINSLEFWMIETEFDPISMCKFLKDNFENDAKFFISFLFNFHHLKQQLIPPVKEIIDGWKTKNLNVLFSVADFG